MRITNPESFKVVVSPAMSVVELATPFERLVADVRHCVRGSFPEARGCNVQLNPIAGVHEGVRVEVCGDDFYGELNLTCTWDARLASGRTERCLSVRLLGRSSSRTEDFSGAVEEGTNNVAKLIGAGVGLAIPLLVWLSAFNSGTVYYGGGVVGAFIAGAVLGAGAGQAIGALLYEVIAGAAKKIDRPDPDLERDRRAWGRFVKRVIDLQGVLAQAAAA